MPSIVFLFDIHGTLASNKQMITKPVVEMLQNIKTAKIPLISTQNNKSAENYIENNFYDIVLAFVSGGDIDQVRNQLGDHMELFDYWFLENGAQFYCRNDIDQKNDQNLKIQTNTHSDISSHKLFSSRNLLSFTSESNLQLIINKSLQILSETDIPIKRGDFISLRSSTLNISPIGRSCTTEERIEFHAYDKEHKIREKIVHRLQETLHSLDFTCSIGGQISIDIFPQGWDKSQCIKDIMTHCINPTIHFYGDMTEPGENDHPIYTHKEVTGHKVINPTDTITQITKYLNQVHKE